MAKMNNNLVMAGISGGLGKQVVFRERNGKTFVSAYPDMSARKLSAKQKQVNKTMRAANKYAQNIMNNEDMLKDAQFRLNLQRSKIYTALVKEYFALHYKPVKA